MYQLIYSLNKKKVKRILVINETNQEISSPKIEQQYPKATIVHYDENNFTALNNYHSFDILVFNFSQLHWVKDFLAQ